MTAYDINEQLKQTLTQYTELTGLETQYIPAEKMYETGCSMCSLCSRIFDSDKGKGFCFEERIHNARIALTEMNERVFVCPTGLVEWVYPIIHNKELSGFVFSGCVASSSLTQMNIIDQKNYYLSAFKIDENELNKLADTIRQISKQSAFKYANLLKVLIQCMEPADSQADTQLIEQQSNYEFHNTDEITNTLTADDIMEEIPDNHPLSFYLSENNLSPSELTVFWNTVESKALDVFTSIISNRFLAGRLALDELMTLAYNGNTMDDIRTSASMLYHITTLKFSSKEFYEPRFYALTYDTLKKLNKCQVLQEVKDVIENSFQTIYNFYNAEIESDENSVSQNIIRYLEQNYKKDIKIDDIGRYLYMSSAYISRIFKAETKTTVKQYLNNIRMRHAQEYVLKSDVKIKDIGYLVGYRNDLRGFYKMFKKHFGMTCREMRQKQYKEF